MQPRRCSSSVRNPRRAGLEKMICIHLRLLVALRHAGHVDRKAYTQSRLHNDFDHVRIDRGPRDAGLDIGRQELGIGLVAPCEREIARGERYSANSRIQINASPIGMPKDYSIPAVATRCFRSSNPDTLQFSSMSNRPQRFSFHPWGESIPNTQSKSLISHVETLVLAVKSRHR